MQYIKYLVSVLALAVSTTAYAVNCEKNPNNPNCQEPSTGAPKFVLRDGDGDVLDLIEVWGSGTGSWFRAVHVDSEGVEHGYGLLIQNKSGSTYVGPYDESAGYYIEPTCTGDPTHVSARPSSFLEPVFSTSYISLYDGWANNSYPGPPYDLARRAPEDQAESIQVYSRRISSSNFTDIELVCSDSGIQDVIPVTIEARDITSQFPPPFTLTRE